MTVYCGVDFHARCQTVSYCDTADGEVHQQDLHHRQDDVRAFYQKFSGEVIVGIEASGYSAWFEELLEGLGQQVWVGDATEIRRLARRRQKNDRKGNSRRRFSRSAGMRSPRLLSSGAMTRRRR
jgi:hypothetical protein